MFGWFSKKKSDAPAVVAEPKTPLQQAQGKIDLAFWNLSGKSPLADKELAVVCFADAVQWLQMSPQPDTREFALCVHKIRAHIAALGQGEGEKVGKVLSRAADALSAPEDAVAKMQLMVSLGKASLQAGRDAEAAILLRALQRQVADACGDFSEEHGDLQDALARAMWGCDQLEDALGAAQQALEIFQKIEGENGLRVARVLVVLLPGIHGALGQADMREAALRRAVKICTSRSSKLDDETRRHYAAALIDLAAILAPRGEAAEAERCLDLAFYQNTKIHGGMHNTAVIRVVERIEKIAASGNLPAAGKYADVLADLRRGP